MQYTIDEAIRKQAKSPHELFLVNILIFHLLLTPATLAMNIGYYGLLLPLFFSGLIILFTYWRSNNAESWFVMAHWKLALRRARLLLFGYLGTAFIMLLGWLITQGMSDERMQVIMFETLMRIAIMPTLILVMVSAVLEAGSINQAQRGEVPDGIVNRYPAPGDVEVVSE